MSSTQQQQQQEEDDDDDDDTLRESESKTPQKKNKIIYFSSGETLMEEDSDEEEEEEEEEEEPAEKASLRRAAVLIGRASLLTVDFLGQRLSSALGLNAAKYQYVIDQYHQNQHMRRKSRENLPEKQETTQICTGPSPSHYGSTGSTGAQEDRSHRHVDRMEGKHNRGFHPEDHVCK